MNEFLIDQAFHLDYLIKVQAQTFGTYSLELDPGLSFKICQIVLSHVGTNFPFMAMPGSSAQLADNVVISWADPTTMFTCGNAVTISFEVRFRADAKSTPAYSSDLHFLGTIMQLSVI